MTHMTDARDGILALKAQMAKAVVRQDDLIEKSLITLLCNGHLLLEGLPGTAKTRAIKTLSRCLEAELGRIQFTPDLLPADITGTEVYHNDHGVERLTFEQGPVFANLVLADEINRAPAKVQSALLEAMEERQVTVAGKTYPLPELFMVMATQNPLEQEGTYPLPEAQTDRFLMKVTVDYPDDEGELQVMRLVRSEEAAQESLSAVSAALIFAARREIHGVHISENVEAYIVALVMATRDTERYPESRLRHYLSAGASPRASISLDRAARAHAWLQGRDYVDPDDVRAMLVPVLQHRLHMTYTAVAEGVTPAEVLAEILRYVAVA
mgnify:CR=1 FL=1